MHVNKDELFDTIESNQYFNLKGAYSMNSCGLIVEYNPFHNGHLHHITEAKRKSNANCMIAVMSGSFLQRGEPAIIDKFHRTKAALASGIDIMLELPFPYAVQSSDFFAKGAVHTLKEIGVSTICFGSESGDTSNFITSYEIFKANQTVYTNSLKKYLKNGIPYPKASKLAYEKIGLAENALNLRQPNNILGFSYVNTILNNELSIKPLAIKRLNSHYHDDTITSSIASATSIRKELLSKQAIFSKTEETMPAEMVTMLNEYKHTTNTWHQWEHYFPFLHFQVLTMSLAELRSIQGVDEGLEYRVKETAKNAKTFQGWMEAMKTKRYTWTRLQRMFIHILTNTKKEDIQILHEMPSVPYLRILGLSSTGQAYLNRYKKEINIPLVNQLSRNIHPFLRLDEKATDVYYSILPREQQMTLRKQEFKPPLILGSNFSL